MEEKFKELFREYRDGKITRREFMPKAVAITGSLVAANSLHEHLSQPNAHAAQVDAGDPTVLSHDVNFPGKAGTVFGYLARPSAPGKYPAVIAIHANQGLNDYARDVARRFVKEGYAAFAGDFLSRHGDTKKVDRKGEGLNNIRELEP